MPDATNEEQGFYQNLIDIGLDETAIKECTELKRDMKTTELQMILLHHRRVLLNSIHISQRQIDCLDFLIHRLDKVGC